MVHKGGQTAASNHDWFARITLTISSYIKLTQDQYNYSTQGLHFSFTRPEAVIQRCSVKMVFLKLVQNLQEITCARDSFLIKLQAFGRCFPVNFVKVFRDTDLYRTPLVAASAHQVIINLQIKSFFLKSFTKMTPHSSKNVSCI